jgi:UDP-glucose 4-epimerase
MNTLIIGGNGFIGSHLIDKLLKEGHSVRVFDIQHERFRKPLINVDYRISSLENDSELEDAMLEIDIIFHLASGSVPSSSNFDSAKALNNTLITTLNVLDLAVKLEIKKLVYFSSGGAVYGLPSSAKINEEHSLKPMSSYGISKVTIEMYLSLYERMHGLKSLIIRPSNPYGPRQGNFNAQGVISTFLSKAKNNETMNVFGDGNSAKDYVYIDDLINLTTKLSFGDYFGVFNIGSELGTSINQIVSQIKSTTGLNLKTNNVKAKIYDVNNFVLNISKLKSKIDHIEFISLSEGIDKTWNWLKNI